MINRIDCVQELHIQVHFLASQRQQQLSQLEFIRVTESVSLPPLCPGRLNYVSRPLWGTRSLQEHGGHCPATVTRINATLCRAAGHCHWEQYQSEADLLFWTAFGQVSHVSLIYTGKGAGARLKCGGLGLLCGFPFLKSIPAA